MKKNIVLLHSNDLHGDFFSEESNENLIGGVSRLSGYINKVRAEEKNVIYAISGDMFRGNIIDSEYQGLSTIEIMNMISPDVVTIGNHETDYGIAHLLFLEKCAHFPIINANMFIKTNMSRLFNPIKIMEIDGMKILFIGIVTEEILANAKSEGIIGTFVDINEAAKEVGKICNSYNAIDIDFTVLLTHIGFEEDKKLASMLDKSWGVDVIIGGHTHTVMEEPTIINDILIVQAGEGTNQIGRFDITIDTDTNSIAKWKWQCLPINEEIAPKDERLEEIIYSYKKETDLKYGRIITRLKRELTHPARNQETEIGNLFADICMKSLGIDIMLMGSGSIRKKTLGPIITVQDLLEIFPYDDSVHLLNIKGAELKNMFLYMLRDEAFVGDHTEFYQISDGLIIEYDKKEKTITKFKFKGKTIKDDDIFKVGIQDYHFLNLETCLNITVDELEKNGKSRVIATSCKELLEEYLTNNQHLEAECNKRIIIKNK